MKTLWTRLSGVGPYAWMLSLSAHALLFSIPATMTGNLPNPDLELFVSVEDRRIPGDPLKPRTEIKKPPPKTLREIRRPEKTEESKVMEAEAIGPARKFESETPDPVRNEPAPEEPLPIAQAAIAEPPRVSSDLMEKRADSPVPPEESPKEIKKPFQEAPQVQPVAMEKQTGHPLPDFESSKEVKKTLEAFLFEVKKQDIPGPIKEGPVKNASNPLSRNEGAGDKPALLPRRVQWASESSAGISSSEKGPHKGASDAGNPMQAAASRDGGKEESPIETRFGESAAPAFLHREMPVYPAMARRLGREGRVLLKLTIDERGTLLNIEVLEKAGYGLTEAAVEAVKKSTFLPAKKNGKPIASRALLSVQFRLERKGW